MGHGSGPSGHLLDTAVERLSYELARCNRLTTVEIGHYLTPLACEDFAVMLPVLMIAWGRLP